MTGGTAWRRVAASEVMQACQASLEFHERVISAVAAMQPGHFEAELNELKRLVAMGHKVRQAYQGALVARKDVGAHVEMVRRWINRIEAAHGNLKTSLQAAGVWDQMQQPPA